jgi:hypothetical protein
VYASGMRTAASTGPTAAEVPRRIEDVHGGKHTTRTTGQDPGAARYADLIRRKWRTPARADQWRVALRRDRRVAAG